MFHRLFSITFIFLLLSGSILPVKASIDDCKADIAIALENVIGTSKTEKDADDTSGYFKDLENLTSTDLSPYLLLDEVEKLARDAEIEMSGICSEGARLSEMDSDYVSVYKLSACQKTKGKESTDFGIEVFQFCQAKKAEHLDEFLSNIPSHLMLNAIRTAMTPFLERLRSLNSRLISLMSDYNRLIKNFFTFNFRLGDKVIKKHD